MTRIESPYCNTEQAADFLCYTGPNRARIALRAMRQAKVPLFRRGGREILVLRESLIDMVQPVASEKRRGASQRNS